MASAGRRKTNGGSSRAGPSKNSWAANGHRSNRTTGMAPIDVDDDEEQEEDDYDELPGPSSRPLARSATRPLDGSVGVDEGGKQAVRVALTKLDAEINDVRQQVDHYQQLLKTLQTERKQLESQLSSFSHQHASSSAGPSSSRAIDYTASTFPWSRELPALLKDTFNIPAFRLCQEGVINAAIDGRDIVCVMPTGGGKSLTYQLPAIRGEGLTVVISPLLALIWDQVRALQEIGVEAVMLTGSTPQSHQTDVMRRMKDGPGRDKREISLLYLTPEKIVNAKRLLVALQDVNNQGRLKRFVIDEAHCCSQLGHDFRKDYKQLSILKTLFPRVPIQAVTATLSSKTLPDLLRILKLKPVCDGVAANKDGTIFFTAPLYRPNLHYKVLAKPGSAKAAIAAIGSWIVENHSGDSGIIYCLSKRVSWKTDAKIRQLRKLTFEDTADLAEALIVWSDGAIQAGAYHAGLSEEEKENLHVRWRKGKINCICATIAFGLGIDKGDVRYVIHHSMSKSLDGYYQETGRAGRDGKDSDCVLFYRGQDMSRLTSLVYSDTDGVDKLREMLRFAQDLRTCRKVAFAKYFSTSAKLSANAWDNAATISSTSGGKLSTCGICDNCTRAPESVITRDVTLEAWRILRVAEKVQREGGRVTVAALCDLVRGLGKGSFAVQGGKKGYDVGTAEVDLDRLVGGKVTLSKDDTELLVLHMVLSGYLDEDYGATAYAVNVYLVPSHSLALRLTRLSLAQVEAGQASAIECSFLDPKAGRKRKAASGGKKGKKEMVDVPDAAEGSGVKRERRGGAAEDEEDEDDEDGGVEVFDLDAVDEEDEDEEVDTPAPPPTKRPRVTLHPKKPTGSGSTNRLGLQKDTKHLTAETSTITSGSGGRTSRARPAFGSAFIDDSDEDETEDYPVMSRVGKGQHTSGVNRRTAQAAVGQDDEVWEVGDTPTPEVDMEGDEDVPAARAGASRTGAAAGRHASSDGAGAAGAGSGSDGLHWGDGIEFVDEEAD